jgi:heat shock protein HtpX
MADPIVLRAHNFYELQKHNRRATWVVLSVIIAFFTVFGMGFDYFYFGGYDARLGFPLATIVVLIVSIALAIISVQGGASTVLASANAAPADPTNQDHQRLIHIVQEMSLAAGLPVPNVYVVPDDDPNAFAAGKDPQHSYIAVTRGLLSMLSREEMQGVVGHEMSHIRNYDIRFMTVVAAFAGAIVLLADLALRGVRLGAFSGRGSRSRGSNPVALVLLLLWLLTALLAPLITRLMAMMISRKREYLADASAAELTRNPLALASALKKLDNATAPTESIKRGVAHLCIVDPLGKPVNEKEGFWAELFATHPPIQKRIFLLQSMAHQPM